VEQRPVPLSVQYAVQNPAQRQVRHAGQSAVEPLTQIVWFKRDLRVTDHAALASAAANGPVLPLYVFEPEYWARSDVSQRQQHFLIETLIDLDRGLMHLGAPLQVFTGSITDVLRLSEFKQSGAIESDVELLLADKWQHIRDVLSARCPIRDETPCVNRQTGGRRHALALMQSFFKHRGHSYHRQMSSPETAEKACSRLSAHIALGSISMRELVQWMDQFPDEGHAYVVCVIPAVAALASNRVASGQAVHRL